MDVVPAYDSLEDAVSALCGGGAAAWSESRVYGGGISAARKLTAAGGRTLFMKSNRPDRLSFFEAEARGLFALARSGAIPVPAPLALGTDRKRGLSFLLMDFVEEGRRKKDYWEDFGRSLAALHLSDVSFLYPEGEKGPLFGFPEDNYIGSTPQKGGWDRDWRVFFRDFRLEPQIRMASPCMSRSVRKRFLVLLDRLEDWIPGDVRPSLLHGDLWYGNAIVTPEGGPMILDPAAYVGHAEADLAMTSLFGGFPGTFYAAYREVLPPAPGSGDRRDLYNLYHLLNHLNLFGEGYYDEVLGVLGRFVR